MDAKDLRIETALGEHKDGSKYSQSRVALQCNKNKSYQDIGTNPLAKAEVTVRPCAVIGPDRVVPPPASNDAYLKKAPVDPWPYPDNLYPRPPEYPYKQLNVNPSRNISPRQTYQENMQRIMVPPTYSAVKHAVEPNINHVQDRNVVLSKNSKQTMAPDAKYCDVPYAMNLLSNEHKNVREPEMCAPSVNSPLARTGPHGWPQSGVNLHAPRTYSAHEVYQYPQYPNCAGPRPPVMPMARHHRTFPEDASYVYPDSYYQDASDRFKPYPSVKDRYPQARYDYINNYPNPFHPPPPYGSHKYDIPNTRPHPYPVYPHLKYLDNRLPDHNIEGYQRPNQQSINHNMQFRNQVIHQPAYAPPVGSTQNKVPSYVPDISIKSSNKQSSDNNKAYVDYEHLKTKYSMPDSYFMNEMARVHQMQKPVAMPNYASPVAHPVPLQQYHRKDSMKTYEYLPHYRHFEHPIGFNPPQFSPSTLAISPTDSNTSNDTTQTQGTLEDCGYVSQSSTTSVRSVDFNINRLHNEYYRRYDYRYRPNIGSSPNMLLKPDLTPTNKENKKIDVRQFLSMWNEGDEENNNNSKEIPTPNNYRHHESSKSQDQLYVLGLVNVPSEELAKYEHIQKVSKLPENIKGYNSIELLNQFEEVIESSNMNSFKSSTSKDFIPMKDRKNAIKQIIEVLPRPVSPLDVEAKISQSVIHKEVGCNFEIKPCSPKMLNVEIAAPVQNILGERAIEKVSNPLSNKAKSPSSMRIDGNTACNKIQKQEMTRNLVYENASCKMVGSPFTANNMESVKANYSLHDLETNSGVCLASLPRLDNEIELNFPEVNQQFINDNKGSRNIQNKYPKEIGECNVNLTISSDAVKNDVKNFNHVSVEDPGTEITKLSKYRKAKAHNLVYSEDESNANAIRTDSVIIENPENIRKIEENTYSHKTTDEDENIPMNLTSQSSSHLKSQSDTIIYPKHEKSIEGALDFSLNKSENELPLLNTYDDELIKTVQNETGSDAADLNGNDNILINCIEGLNKPLKLFSDVHSNESNTKSIIVRNNQSASSNIKLKEDTALLGADQNDSPHKILDTSDKYFKKGEPMNISHHNVKAITEISFDKNKTNKEHKESSTHVIVKHKHKNKFKKSKAKVTITHFEQELPSKNMQNKLIEIDENIYHMADSEVFEQNINNAKSVIQNNSVSNECEKKEAAVSHTHKDEVEKKYPLIDDNHRTLIAEGKIDDNDNTTKAISMNDDAVNNHKAKTNTSPQTDYSENVINSKILMTDEAKNLLICNKEGLFKSSTGICKPNKYYSDLISESELLVDKTFAENLTLSNSFIHKETTSAIAMEIMDHSTEVSVLKCFEQQKINDVTNYQAFSKSPESDSPATVLDGEEVLDNFQCGIGKDELIKKPPDEFVIKSTMECRSCKFDEENVTGNNGIVSSHENTNSINLRSDIAESVDESTATIISTNIENCTAIPDAKLLLDKTYSVDSGYQSNKNSFTESDEGITGFLGNSSEDSVFMEQESRSNKITLNDSDNSDSIDNRPILTTTFSSLVNTSTIENNITEVSNQKSNREKLRKTLQTSNLFDSVDAKMQILFKQETHSENVNVDSVNIKDNIKSCLKHDNETNTKEVVGIEISCSVKEYVDANSNDEILFVSKKELNKNVCNIGNNSIFNIQVNDKCNQIGNDTNISSNSMGITDMIVDEPYATSMSNEMDTKIHTTLNSIFDSQDKCNEIGYVQILPNSVDITDVVIVEPYSKSLSNKVDPKVNASLTSTFDVQAKDKCNDIGYEHNNSPNAVDLADVVIDEPCGNSLTNEVDSKASATFTTIDIQAKDKCNEISSEHNNPPNSVDITDVVVSEPYVKKLSNEVDPEVNSSLASFFDIQAKDKCNDIGNEHINSPNSEEITDVVINKSCTKSLRNEVDSEVTTVLNSIIDIQANLTSNEHDSSPNSMEVTDVVIDEPCANKFYNEDDHEVNASLTSIFDIQDKDKCTNFGNEHSILTNSVEITDVVINEPCEKSLSNIVDSEVNVTLNSVIGIQAKEKSNDIGIDHNSSPNSMETTDVVIDDACTKSSSNEVDYEVNATMYTKKYSGYQSKKLYSPWIQKLIMYNEGKLNTHEVKDAIETKLLNNNVVACSLVIPNIGSNIKSTLGVIDNEVYPKDESKLIKDAYVEIDEKCIKVDCEANTNNYINTSNDESNSIPSKEIDSKINFDIPEQKQKFEINAYENSLAEPKNKSDFGIDCTEGMNIPSNSIDNQDISFSYSNNSITSQITEDTFNINDSKLEFKCQENNDEVHNNCLKNCVRPLKRSFSDSALNVNISRDVHNNIEGIENLHYHWASKRNRIGDIENYLPNNRRNSVNTEENVSFCILIDDNCIITEESEEKICIAELQEEFITEIETENEGENTELLKELCSSDHETEDNYVDSVVLECQEENTIQDSSWIENITCAEDVFSDEVAENVVISALSSPTGSASEYEHDDHSIYSNTTSCSHTDKVKLLHKQNMSENDAQIVDTLYRTPHMNIMNKTLLYGDKNIESDNDQDSIILESDDWRPSPVHTPDYIDPTQVSTDFRLETPENKENVFVKDLSPLRRIDDYLDVSSAENENDENFQLHHVPEFDKGTQNDTVYSSESSLDDVLDYKLNDKSINNDISTSSCSPEVSSTTSEEKNSSILLKITNMNGSRVSQINEIETIRRPRCKFTEKKEYSTSNLNFPNRPLMTKGAQKYIPPIKESIRDLKVKINLPQQSLLKLKQLKLSLNEPKLHKQHVNIAPRITKKPKPNFDDVLKSIDEIQIKRHKEKSKKVKVPKVVIKKTENGSHYASTPKRDTFSPDLTGRKWQPWVFLEKNSFIDKMAIKNTTKAIFSHRKKTYVLAEKFKKYKSASCAKFVISQPKTPGQLKYTIRLKHTL